jgi:hypothetical protein
MTTFSADGDCMNCGQRVDTGHECPPRLSPQPHTCPVCNGHCKVSRPPQVPGDLLYWTDSGTTLYDCRACQGTGIVWGPP